MSCATANLPIQVPGIYRSNSATTALPLPAIAVRGSNSITRPDNERSGLLLGSSLLMDDPVFSAFFQSVKALQNDQEEDAPPDDHALAEVLRLVPYSRNQLAQRWSPPQVATDGFGGIRLTWQNSFGEVRAVISGKETVRSSYLYWENCNGYGTIPNFTPTTLFTFLESMEKAAPFER